MCGRGVNWGNQDLHFSKGPEGYSGALSFRSLVVLLSFILATVVSVLVAAGCGIPIFDLVPSKVGTEWGHRQAPTNDTLRTGP